MKLLTMPPDSHGCLIYSAAMVLEVDPKVLVAEIGKDGLDTWWSDLDPPRCYRSFHIQEIIDCFLERNFALTPIEIYPVLVPQGHPENMKRTNTDEEAQKRFEEHITNRSGILIGLHSSGGGHACAWDGRRVYDPNGNIYGLDGFFVRECWIMTEIGK